MLKQILEAFVRPKLCITRRYSSKATDVISSYQTDVKPKFVSDAGEMDEKALLETIIEDKPDDTPYLKPTFNFAAYVNKSDVLQQLVKLGVDLYKIEKGVKAIPFILALKFDDIKDHIIFFRELGLEREDVAFIISKNPFIFKETVENLQVRINYLEYKKFSKDMVLRIVKMNPFWLNHSTKDIDERLGFFQRNFFLSGNQVRSVATMKPKLITYDLEKIKTNIFIVKEEMGFSPDEMKSIILRRPSVFMQGQERLLRSFEYLHNTMNISLDRLVETPEILSCRQKRLMQRHKFLVKLGRDQFNPKMPNYIALTTLATVNDSEFATEIAKSSIQTFNLFLKTL